MPTITEKASKSFARNALNFKGSSHLSDAVWLDGLDGKGSVTVTFKNGRRYRHTGVPRGVWMNWAKDVSAGKFYHVIVARYPYEELK